MSGLAAAGATLWLADPTDVGDEAQKAGPIAMVVIIVLCVVCFFLFRSMSKHLRRVREDFPAEGESSTASSPVASAGAPAARPDGAAPASTRPHVAPKSRASADDPAPR